MSEKFGLDWKEYDAKRIILLQIAISERNKYESREIRKNQQNVKR